MASVTTTVVQFPHPPRLTGNRDHDAVAIIEYLWSFFRVSVEEGGFALSSDFVENWLTVLTEQTPRLAALAILETAPDPGNPPAADTLGYFTGLNTWGVTALTEFARSLLAAPDDDAVLTELGILDFVTDVELLALASVTSAADKLPYFTGLGSADVTTLTAFSRSLLAEVDQAAWQTALGIGVAPGSILLTDIEDISDGMLLGRSAGSDGPPMEISVGSGLSLAAGVLEATVSASWVPLASGSEPITWISDGSGNPIMVTFSP